LNAERRYSKYGFPVKKIATAVSAKRTFLVLSCDRVQETEIQLKQLGKIHDSNELSFVL